VDWRAFTLSGWQSETALKPVQASLKKFTSDSETWPVTVTSPQGTKFDCNANAYVN